jgi:hypothetical protein
MASKIKVDTIENVAGSGNVSLGSGHNLVVPGNNSTTGNATVGGDLTVDTNVLKVDSSNNRVGIGTASPLSDLHQDIGLTEREGHHLYYGTDAKAAFTVLPNTGEIRIGAATAGTSGNYNTEIMSRNGSNLITSIKADAYGRVTMPNQPHVRATVASGTTAINFTSNGNTTVPYNQILENNGSHFNTGNHLFTCPVSGVYAVYAALQASNVVQAIGQVAPNLSIQRNSTRTSGTYDWVAQANYKKLECTAFIKCSANDTLAINLYDGANSTSGSTEFNGDARNIFMVTLLG